MMLTTLEGAHIGAQRSTDGRDAADPVGEAYRRGQYCLAEEFSLHVFNIPYGQLEPELPVVRTSPMFCTLSMVVQGHRCWRWREGYKIQPNGRQCLAQEVVGLVRRC